MSRQQRLQDALAAIAAANDAPREHDPVELLAKLVAAIRPDAPDDEDEVRTNVGLLTLLVERNAGYRLAVQRLVADLFRRKRLVRFYAESGILEGTGFYSELARRIGGRALPEVPDRGDLRDCIRLVFSHPDDHRWLALLPREDAVRFWAALRPEDAVDAEQAMRSAMQLLVALRLLATRTAAAGTRADFLKDLGLDDPARNPFLSLVPEVERFAAAYETADVAEDEKHLLVLVDQCKSLVRRRRHAAATEGTDTALTYLLEYLDQTLERIALVASMLGARFTDAPGDALLERWVTFFGSAVRGENARAGVRRFLSQMTSMVALRVTENASRTGEHYITGTPAEYLGMWRSAMGAGVIIGVMALIKILTAKLDLAPLGYAFFYSMNYAFGFMLVHLLHFTIATKQPAMTAATIAAAIGQGRGRLRDLERVVDLVAQTCRSQLAAILGNVMVAFPVALAVGVMTTGLWGPGVIGAEKAEHLLHDLSPIASLAIPHAAIAGVCLFLTGLIGGWFDNRAAYRDYRERIAALPWLRRLAGPKRASRAGDFVHEHLGGLAGNFCFGIMLGSIGTLGSLVGLPLDIRHVAFAAANLAYAVVGTGFDIGLWGFLAGVVGVALIGFTNLVVSFSLALWVALRARDAEIRNPRELLRRIGRRVVNEPRSFFLPPRPTVSVAQT